TYKIMGYNEEETRHSVGHMLEALRFGAPPHGGIGMGVERTAMILTGEQYLREVQAFPMTASARVSVMDAPSELDAGMLQELQIQVRKP
ncbi:aspartate--tRNA ligase, partial [Candidatus Parcubacteria bacterium]|nr:aspartate--tRNA ligase [Candidatus Parcubacteria bacterium]